MQIMIRYEIKKVFGKTANKAALLILLLIVGIVCYLACDIQYVNEQGEPEYGPHAVATLKNMKKEWTGILDEEKLAAVIAENKELSQMPGYNSLNGKEADMVYSKGQGIADIRDLLNHAFATGFRSYDYYRADALNENDAKVFYKMRIKTLKDWLNSDEAEYMYSEEEKRFLSEQYETLETPFYYDYVTGWEQLFQFFPTVIMLTMLVVGFIISSLFSCEYAWKTDAIFFSSEMGKNKAIIAKLTAGFCIVTIVYFAAAAIYSLITLGYLGTDGANCVIQLISWKSFYNIKIWQEYLLIILGGYVGCLFISSLCMFASAKCKMAVVAIVIPFALLFVPSFVGMIQSSSVNRIMGLLPDQLLQVNMVLVYFNMYQIGGKVVGALGPLFAIYCMLTIVMFPVTYKTFRNM